MNRDRATHITIWQPNVNKSLTVQSNFLHQLNPDIYNLTAIQEPYLDHNHNLHTTHHWYTLYPKEHYTSPTCTRLLLLVNKWLATDAWTQIDFELLDIMVVQLHMQHGKILIINLYNDLGHQPSLKQTIQKLWHRMHMEGRAATSEHNSHLFTRPNLEKGQVLIEPAADLDMQMTLPKNTPTLWALATGNYMQPDNIFISTLLTNALTYYFTIPEEQLARTDHIPIVTKLDIGVDTQMTSPCPNFRRAS